MNRWRETHKIPKLKVSGRSFLWFLDQNKVAYFFVESGLISFESERDYDFVLRIWLSLTGSNVFGRQLPYSSL